MNKNTKTAKTDAGDASRGWHLDKDGVEVAKGQGENASAPETRTVCPNRGQPKARDVEAMFQALVDDNEGRRIRGLPTFEPSYELADKALKNAIASAPETRTVCPNCGQYQNPHVLGGFDCLNECVGRGLAPAPKASAPDIKAEKRAQ